MNHLGSMLARLCKQVSEWRCVFEAGFQAAPFTYTAAPVSFICVRYHSTVFLRPSSKYTKGRYPRCFSAFEMSASEWRTAQRASTTWWSYEPETKDLAAAEWTVAGEPGQTVTVTARHPRAGTARLSATL